MKTIRVSLDQENPPFEKADLQDEMLDKIIDDIFEDWLVLLPFFQKPSYRAHNSVEVSVQEKSATSCGEFLGHESYP